MERKTMSDLIQLTEAEISGVSGGNQSISITAYQTNNSSVTQTSYATNYGAVSASVGTYSPYSTAAAAGAESTNIALVTQSNSISANNVSIRRR
jgi:hypothetical protein